MIRTDHFVRFQRVDAVREIPHGLVADLHGEQLRVEPVQVDVVRLKISRGGRFDDSPTFAVCVDPLAELPDEDPRSFMVSVYDWLGFAQETLIAAL